MLFFEFSIPAHVSKNLKLVTVRRASRINTITSGKRTITNTDLQISGSNNTEPEVSSKSNVTIGRATRPRGRPRKVRLESNLVHGDNTVLSKYTDVKSYLEYASYKNLKTTSGIFIGNLYELQVKKYLEEKFKIQSVLHQGGSNDKGIDINAVWRPADVFEHEKHDKESIESSFQIVNSKRVKPLISRNNQSLKLFVQCKCFDKSKIDPKLIREIKGSCQEYFKKHGNAAVFMLASTNGFTRMGKEDFDKATIPLIFAKFSKPQLMNSKSPYDSKSWDMGKLMGIYLNPMAIALFKGLDWIKFMNQIK